MNRNDYNAVISPIPLEEPTLEVSGTVRSESTASEFTMELFLKMFPEFREILTREKSMYATMFDIYKNIAKDMFTESLFGSNINFIYGLYIAHNLTLSLNRTKNVNNAQNLSTMNFSKTVGNNVGGVPKNAKMGFNSFENEYYLTEYGVQLHPLISMILKLEMVGVY